MAHGQRSMRAMLIEVLILWAVGLFLPAVLFGMVKRKWDWSDFLGWAAVVTVAAVLGVLFRVVFRWWYAKLRGR